MWDKIPKKAQYNLGTKGKIESARKKDLAKQKDSLTIHRNDGVFTWSIYV